MQEVARNTPPPRPPRARYPRMTHPCVMRCCTHKTQTKNLNTSQTPELPVCLCAFGLRTFKNMKVVGYVLCGLRNRLHVFSVARLHGLHDERNFCRVSAAEISRVSRSACVVTPLYLFCVRNARNAIYEFVFDQEAWHFCHPGAEGSCITLEPFLTWGSSFGPSKVAEIKEFSPLFAQLLFCCACCSILQ